MQSNQHSPLSPASQFHQNPAFLAQIPGVYAVPPVYPSSTPWNAGGYKLKTTSVGSRPRSYKLQCPLFLSCNTRTVRFNNSWCQPISSRSCIFGSNSWCLCSSRPPVYPSLGTGSSSITHLLNKSPPSLVTVGPSSELSTQPQVQLYYVVIFMQTLPAYTTDIFNKMQNNSCISNIILLGVTYISENLLKFRENLEGLCFFIFLLIFCMLYILHKSYIKGL